MSNQKFIEVYFHHTNGGVIAKHGSVNTVTPVLTMKKSPSPFRIIPFHKDGDFIGEPSTPSWTVATRREFSDMLKSEEYQYVAIQNDEGKYISCRRKVPGAGALAVYKDTVVAFEKFLVEYNPTSSTFAFKSHNGLYLHYNHYNMMISFKERERERAGWIVDPFQLKDPDHEKIRFFGVANKDGNFLYQKYASVDIAPAWPSDVILQGILKELFDKMSLGDNSEAGSCTIFHNEFGDNQWIVTRSKENQLNVVITTADCPYFISTHCIEELESIFDKTEIIEREQALNKLLIDLKEKYEFSISGNHKEVMKNYETQILEHIEKLQDNEEHAQDFVARVNELKDLGIKCNKKLSQPPGNKYTRSAKEAPTKALIGVVNLAGSVTRSKVGHKIFGDQASTKVLDVANHINSEASSPIYKFWTRRFVSFGKTMNEASIDLSPLCNKKSDESKNHDIFCPMTKSD